MEGERGTYRRHPRTIDVKPGVGQYWDELGAHRRTTTTTWLVDAFAAGVRSATGLANVVVAWNFPAARQPVFREVGGSASRPTARSATPSTNPPFSCYCPSMPPTVQLMRGDTGPAWAPVGRPSQMMNTNRR